MDSLQEMKSEVYYIENAEWQKFLSQLSQEFNIYAPREGLVGSDYQIFKTDDLPGIIYGEARFTQPLKYFLYPPREKLSSIPLGSEHPKANAGSLAEKKNLIFGIKACDLRAIRILDKIFLEPDFIDPFYLTRRENTLLISNDCTMPLETCFCILFGEKPFPQEGFDLNLSFLSKGILIEVYSARGKALLEAYQLPMHPAADEDLKILQEKRQKVIQRLEEINKDFKLVKNLHGLVEGKYNLSLWAEISEHCVGCTACTNICPACHCFFLAEAASAKFEKIRYWDSCQYSGFSRVAGGANPREKLMERFRNRFYCKFEYKPKNFNLLACTGCGRCIEACLGKIDIREVLTRIANS
jgi:sulfhydrogenase subunit beta (sulfur reductase)